MCGAFEEAKMEGVELTMKNIKFFRKGCTEEEIAKKLNTSQELVKQVINGI